MKRIIILFIITILVMAVLTVGASAFPVFWQTNASAELPIYPTQARTFAGDVDNNGLLEPADARLALRLSVGLPIDGNIDRAAADVIGSGSVTPEDARQILRGAVGLVRWDKPRADGYAYRLRVSSMFEQFSKLGALIPLEVNAAPVTDDGDTLPLWRLRSRAELEAFVEAYHSAGLTPFYGIDVPVLLMRYDDAFFAERELFICYMTEDSGSNLPAVYAPVKENGTMTFTVGCASPVVVTCDIADWFLFLPTEKTDTEGCDAFECRRGPGELLPYAEYKAAQQGQSKWEYASDVALNAEIPMASRITVGLRRGGENAFTLVNEQDAGYLWTYETDAPLKEYTPECLLSSSEEENACLWLREERITIPGAEFGTAGLQLYTVSAREPGTYALRFQLKRAGEQECLDETTVTVVVADDGPYILTELEGPDNRIAIVDYFGDFRPEEALSPTNSAGYTYHTCTFRGVIESVTRYAARWQGNDGEFWGDHDRTLLRVRITDAPEGLTDRETVTLLYPFEICKTEHVPVTVEEGKEYWFLNCYLLDETYFSNAKAQGFDTKDPTLRMADAITGYAARSFVPAEDGRCTVFREFFTEEQLADPANVVTSIPNTQFVTVDEAFWRTRLLKLMGE